MSLRLLIINAFQGTKNDANTHTHTHTHTEMHPPVIYHEACFFFLLKMSPCAEIRLLKNPKQDQKKFLFIVIPLRAKREGEFIEIRHKKISPTRILSTLGCL